MIATQVVTGLLGVGLVLLAPLAVMSVRPDRIAALLAAATIALDPLMILTARQGYVDVINAFLIILLIFLVPSIRRQPSLALLVAFGLGIGLLFSIRPTNVVIVPVLALYAVLLSDAPTSLRALQKDLGRPVLIVGAVFALSMAASILAGSWFGGGYSSDMITAERLPQNLWALAQSLFRNVFGLILILPPAALGSVQLWRQKRALAISLALFFLLWSLVHLPFNFFNYRYMLPVVFLVFFLAALGWSALIQNRPVIPPRRNWKRLYGLASCGALLVILTVVSTLLVFRDWPELAATSDAGMAQRIGPTLKELDESSLVVSVVSDAVRLDNSHLNYVDLFQLSVENRTKEMGAQMVSSEIGQALGNCGKVYYLYSQAEARKTVYGGIWDDYGIYFDAVASDFAVSEIYRIERTVDHDPWVLYSVESRGGRGCIP